MIKYRLAYYDIVNIEHKCYIYDDNYTDSPIDIKGTVYLDYTSVDNNLDVVRSQGLRVELEANTNLNYSDLYAEEEKSFLVEYYRDGVLKFKGWLNPEGWFEDFVSDEWVVSFDCIDGLGYLNNLSFVEDSGLSITGKIKQSEALFKALKRTGIEKNMYISIDIRYTGLSSVAPILDNVYVIAERYIKDDGDTFMSCEEVIKDILEPYGAVLTSFSDGWYIYKPNELFSKDSLTFTKYDLDGVSYQYVNKNFKKDIGSQLNNYDVFHCSENQRIEVKPSIGAYRISYKYGIVKSFVGNDYLISNDGVTIDGYPNISTVYLQTPFPIGTGGVTFDNKTQATSVWNLKSEEIILDGSVSVDIEMDWYTLTSYVKARYKIYVGDKPLPDGTANVYYLQDDLTWGVVNDPEHILESAITRGTKLEITTPPVPFTGNSYLYIGIHTPYRTPFELGESELRFLTVSPSENSFGSPKNGEFHTFKRISKPSAQVKDIKEVATGDNPTDIYLGTTYKSDQLTPTETWNRKGFTEEKPLLRIMGEETMRMHQLPTRVFSGDVFNYLDILSVISIEDVDGRFMINEYSYNTRQNTTSLKMRQVLGAELSDQDDDKFYETGTDYGNTVKPTIEG